MKKGGRGRHGHQCRVPQNERDTGRLRKHEDRRQQARACRGTHRRPLSQPNTRTHTRGGTATEGTMRVHGRRLSPQDRERRTGGGGRRCAAFYTNPCRWQNTREVHLTTSICTPRVRGRDERGTLIVIEPMPSRLHQRLEGCEISLVPSCTHIIIGETGETGYIRVIAH